MICTSQVCDTRLSKHIQVVTKDRLAMGVRFLGLMAPLIVIIGLLMASLPTRAQTPSPTPAMEQPRMSVLMPVINAKRGRRLFVTKGCFICHSVKGVGSKVAPALDAKSISNIIDVTGFAARMWNGAPIMLELQALELGYRVKFTATEIADLAGFISDPKAQTGFSLEEIPKLVREWIVREAWWKTPSESDWRKILPKEFPDIEGLEPSKP